MPKNRGKKFQGTGPEVVNNEGDYCYRANMHANFCFLKISMEFQAFGNEETQCLETRVYTGKSNISYAKLTGLCLS